MRDLLRRALAAVLLQDVDPALDVDLDLDDVECDCDVCRLVSMLDALDRIRSEEIAALNALYAAPAYGEGGWSPMT